MTSVQELSNDGSAAHRPGPAPVDLNQCGRHHMVVFEFPKDLLTCLHIVVGHVEDVAWGKRVGWEERQKVTSLLESSGSIFNCPMI